MTPYRDVRKARPDKNHSIPSDYLRDRCGGPTTSRKSGIEGGPMVYTANYHGVFVVLTDTSHYGGAALDYEMQCPETGRYAKLEVKTPEAYDKPNHSLKPGEIWTLEQDPRHCHIIVTEDDFEQVLNWITGDDELQ